LVGESGPRAIAVGADGIFWTWSGGGPYEGKIGHASLGGGGVLDEIPSADVGTASGLAITGSDLYWFNFEEGSGVSLAHASLEGSGSSVDRHFVDHVGYGSLVANSAGPSPVPAPPPPPSISGQPPGGSASGSGSTGPPTPAPLKVLRAPKVKLNRKAGTATLTLAVPGPGRLALSGAGVSPVRKVAKAAGPVTLTVRPTAKTASKLKDVGSARVAVKLTFTPSTGEAIHRLVKLKLREGAR
jgi:hypothetical protein